MQACVERGCRQEGILPGGLKVRRRAPELFRQLSARDEAVATRDPLAGDGLGRSVRAGGERGERRGRARRDGADQRRGRHHPGRAALLWRFVPGANDDGIVRFLLTAGAIGILYKLNASISGAEVGCQGEVGVACSMAAGALTEVLGGTRAAGRDGGRDRHGAQPRPHLRPDRRAGAGAVHRAVRDGGGEGDQRLADGAAQRRHSTACRSTA